MTLIDNNFLFEKSNVHPPKSLKFKLKKKIHTRCLFYSPFFLIFYDTIWHLNRFHSCIFCSIRFRSILSFSLLFLLKSFWFLVFPKLSNSSELLILCTRKVCHALLVPRVLHFVIFAQAFDLVWRPKAADVCLCLTESVFKSWFDEYAAERCYAVTVGF